MTQDEIIEMARKSGDKLDKEWLQRFANLVAAKAIAELQSQEPVALQYPQKDIDWQREQQIKAQASTPPQGIYYTPPQRTWVGLTVKEVNDLYDSDYSAFHQRIEAKLKQKNG